MLHAAMNHHAPTGVRHRLTDAWLSTGPTLRVQRSSALAELVAGESINDAPGRADHALDRAKGAGRNRAVAAAAESAST